MGGDSKARETVALLPQVEADDFALLTGLLAPLQFIIGGFCAAFSAGIKLGIVKEIKLKNPIYWNICAARQTKHVSDALDFFWKTPAEQSVPAA